MNRCEDCHGPCSPRAKSGCCRKCAINRRNGEVDPTPEEIRERCLAIQAEWSDDDRRRREVSGRPSRRDLHRVPSDRRVKLHHQLAPDDLLMGLYSLPPA